MESRVLSRAATFAPLPHLRKPQRESGNNSSVSFVSARPIGAVGEGGNLIWGRQLRPALLLESSSLGAKVPRPSRVCSAASSSPAEGSDSAGWGPFPPFWLGREVVLFGLFSLTRLCFLQGSEDRSGRVLREVPVSHHGLLLLHVVGHVHSLTCACGAQ